MMTIYDKLVELRKSKGWSQEDLAERLNVSRQAISRWENGTALPDAGNLLQLSQLYGVSADYLLNDEYESDADLPSVKSIRTTFDHTVKDNQKFLFIAAAAFLVAVVGFTIAGIEQRNMLLIILAVSNAALAGVTVYRYQKGKQNRQ